MRRRSLLAGGCVLLGGCLTGQRATPGDSTGTASAAGSMAGADAWPTAGANSRNTGQAYTSGPGPGALVEWSFDTGGPTLFGSPTVADRTVFTGSATDRGDSGAVFALDADDGTERWRHEFGSYVQAAPTVDGGAVYAASWLFRSDDEYALHALDAGDGGVRWRGLRGAYVQAAPTVAEGVLYVGLAGNSHTSDLGPGDGEAVVAVDPGDGRVLWTAATPDRVYAPPAVADGSVYAVTDSGTLIALDAATGDRRWKYPTDYGHWFAAPAVADGRVFLSAIPADAPDQRAHAVALDAASGDESWRTEIGGLNPRSSPAVGDDTVYVNVSDGGLAALDTETGEKRWQRPPAGGDSDPAVVDGTLYVGGYHGLVAVLTNGTPIWYVRLGDQVKSSPAVAAGTAYVGCRDGSLYAIR